MSAPGIVSRSEFEAGVESSVEPGAGDGRWRPTRFRCEPAARGRLESFCATRGIEVLDTLHGQLGELARVRHPGADQGEARAGFVRSWGPGGAASYEGVWIHFPWSRRVVRVLEADDYFDVITSRNQDKITRAEQLALREKTIGVVGLSVGAEIAVALAQEHLCGRIRVADFDELELSNLNRLGGGIHDLGVNKAWLTARRIAEMDPWLEVEVYPEGLTEANADAFLRGLDLVIDECDSLGLKYRLREWARERRLNLLFAADERGMLSIEPYAHTELQPFHGRIPGPHGDRSSYGSDLAFYRALTDWLGGWDAISSRSRASVRRIGRDLAGYPQLAGEPRFAAGQVTHAARRLLLGERLPPFFGFQDLDEFIPSAGSDGPGSEG